LACFSFHAVKNLATGDGGMIVTNNEQWYRRLEKLRWVGINKDTWSREDFQGAGNSRYSWYYDIEELGFKYHMNDINAAIGLVQLKKLDKLNARRLKIVAQYQKLSPPSI